MRINVEALQSWVISESRQELLAGGFAATAGQRVSSTSCF